MTKAPEVYTLKNRKGLAVSFIARGGQITSIKVPNEFGKIADVVLGYDTIEETLNGDSSFGAICGRYANCIVDGQFEIKGESFQLDKNNGVNHYNGGVDGFDKRIWEVEPLKIRRFVQAYKLSLMSPDGDQNYPGELSVSVVYGITEENEFAIEYSAKSTKDTVINLTSHAYFNLKGAGEGTIADHELTLNSDKYTVLDDKAKVVNGEIAQVRATAMDFASGDFISEALESNDPQVKLMNGINHNYVISAYDESLRIAARLEHEESGRMMEVYTDQPGIQVYTGNHFDGTQIGKQGKPMQKWDGIALMSQIFPDSPNQANFPNAILKAGRKYSHTCVYRFL